jgi:putative membrane protein
MFFAAAIVYWWPFISPSQVAPRRPPGVQILYVVASGALQFPLIAFLTFSREVLYPTYEFAPRLINLSARDDQVLGGTIMGIGGMFMALGLISWCFYRWHRQSEADSASSPPPTSP